MAKQVFIRDLKYGDKFRLFDSDSAPFWFLSHRVERTGKYSIIRVDNTYELYAPGSKLVFVY